MSIGLLFWILMLIWLVFGVAWYRNGAGWAYGWYGNSLLLFILFVILGWRVFGQPLHG